MVIFDRKSLNPDWAIEEVPGTFYGLSDSGWIDTELPYGRKFWRGIYFGGLAVLRAIRQYFHLPNFLQYVTSSIWRPLSFKMSAQKLQTSKEWNENSPDLVYYRLVPDLFDVLWFQTDPAVFTLLTVPVCYICYHFAMNIIMV